MQNRFLSWLVIFAFAAMASVAQAPALLSPGEVLVAKVTGKAWVEVAGGAKNELVKSMRVPEAATISTGSGRDDGVVLAFSNGATTQLGPNTVLVLEEYLQAPFSKEVVMKEVDREPTRSRTRLTLRRGELIGHVRKLNLEEKSEFTVVTPVGAAGIRGTKFRILFNPEEGGRQGQRNQWTFKLVTLEGDVRFETSHISGARGSVPIAGGAVEIPLTVLPGNEGVKIEVTLTVEQLPGGQVRVTGTPTVTTSRPIDAQQQVEITKVVQEITAAVESLVFSWGGNGPTGRFSDGGSGDKSGGDKDSKKDEKGDKKEDATPEPESVRTTPLNE